MLSEIIQTNTVWSHMWTLKKKKKKKQIANRLVDARDSGVEEGKTAKDVKGIHFQL